MCLVNGAETLTLLNLSHSPATAPNATVSAGRRRFGDESAIF
jgi:hypothetical protein